jgi:flagellin
MRELAVQATNSTNTTGAGGDIDKLNNEYKQLGAELSRMQSATQFNGVAILSGTGAYDFQVGANSGADNRITVASGDLSLQGVIAFTSVASGGTTAAVLDIADNTANAARIGALDAAIGAVNDRRATLGAVQSRFENTINYLRTSSENQAASRGRIMDADFAAETANLSRAQILQQAGTAMIAQANQSSQGVLSLLQ